MFADATFQPKKNSLPSHPTNTSQINPFIRKNKKPAIPIRFNQSRHVDIDFTSSCMMQR